jgi:hypothetical protein
MHSDPTAAHVAAILNAAWTARNQRDNAHGRSARHEALLRMAAATRAALNESAGEPEPILYAVAVGLYARSDARFQV